MILNRSPPPISKRRTDQDSFHGRCRAGVRVRRGRCRRQDVAPPVETAASVDAELPSNLTAAAVDKKVEMAELLSVFDEAGAVDKTSLHQSRRLPRTMPN